VPPNEPHGDLPRLFRLKHLAILADFLIGPTHVKNHHKTGVNVGYAHRVNLADFHNPDWDTIQHDDFGPEHGDSLLNDNTTPATGVWPELDRH
jgi:hypothetical protein